MLLQQAGRWQQAGRQGPPVGSRRPPPTEPAQFRTTRPHNHTAHREQGEEALAAEAHDGEGELHQRDELLVACRQAGRRDRQEGQAGWVGGQGRRVRTEG